MVKFHRYKLLALDVDGTLLNGRNVISRENREALGKAIAEGMKVTLATGRAFPSALSYARMLGLTTPLVTHDGAYVADPVTAKVLFERRIAAETAREAAAILLQCGLNANLLHEEYSLSNQPVRNWSWDRLKPSRLLASAAFWKEAVHYKHRYSSDLVGELKRNPVSPLKLYVTGPADRIEEGKRLLAERLGDALRTAGAGAEAMEVIPQGVSKASGLAILAEALGITLNEVIAVGDNYNDVEMIREVGLGVAMENAPDDVRWSARFVTRSNEENGVAYVVERFVLDGKASA